MKTFIEQKRSSGHSKNRTGDSKACLYTGSPSYLCIGADLQSDCLLEAFIIRNVSFSNYENSFTNSRVKLSVFQLKNVCSLLRRSY